MTDTLIRIIMSALSIVAIGGAVALVCDMLLWAIYRDRPLPCKDDLDDETAEERE